MEWIPIEGYEGVYWINSSGQIKNRFDKIKSTFHTRYCKYPSIFLEKKGVKKAFMVHRLVAKYFLPNPFNKSQVNHIDKDKSNYSVENLEWVTPKENMTHHYENGGVKRNNQTYKNKFGKDHNRSVTLELNGQKFYGYSEASRLTGVPVSTIHYCVKKNKPVKGMHFQLSNI